MIGVIVVVGTAVLFVLAVGWAFLSRPRYEPIDELQRLREITRESQHAIDAVVREAFDAMLDASVRSGPRRW